MSCVLILGGILTAGLWPFHAPKNQVSWLPEGQGLRFGRHGTLVSSSRLNAASEPSDAPFTIELWIEASPSPVPGTIMEIHPPPGVRQLSIRQADAALVIESDPPRSDSTAPAARLSVDDILHPGSPKFVTIASGDGQTSVYVDGILARQFGPQPWSGRDLAGQIIVANASGTFQSWLGTLQGLALYRRSLTAAQVQHHFETWTKAGRPDIGPYERVAELCLVNEGAGRLVHNQIPGGTDLVIPERYVVVDQYFLEPFWREFELTWSFAETVLVNIAGLIPLGFTFFAYFCAMGRPKRPALATIFLGFAASVTIEVTQAWLPTRASGTTDIFTNTLGAALGVLLFGWASRRQSLVKAWAIVVKLVPLGPDQNGPG